MRADHEGKEEKRGDAERSMLSFEFLEAEEKRKEQVGRSFKEGNNLQSSMYERMKRGGAAARKKLRKGSTRLKRGSLHRSS